MKNKPTYAELEKQIEVLKLNATLHEAEKEKRASELTASKLNVEKSDEFARRIIASSADCIKVLDLDGNLLSMSESGQRLREIKNIDIYLNKSWLNLWKGECYLAAKKAILDAKNGKHGIFRGFSPTEKGNPKWWEIIISPINDSKGNIVQLLAVSRDNTVQYYSEKKERIHHNNIEILSKTAMQFVEFPQDSNIYDFVGEQVREFVGKNSYIVVNSIDCKTGFSTINSVHGVGKLTKIITNKLGGNPVGMKIEVEDPNLHHQDGKLHVYQDGLYGLLFNSVPKSICKSIEKLAGVTKIYVIDLAKQQQFFGNIIIFLKEKTGELKNKQLIETFIKQASIAILKKQAEEALKINEEKRNLIINSSPIGICTVDMLGNFITTNTAYELMLGYSKEELVGLSFFDVTHPNDRPKNKKLFQDMFSLETTNFSMEKRYMRKDGKEIKVLVNAIGIKDAEGIVRFGTAFVDNITERKQAEEALLNANARHSAMIENIGDVIAIMAADGIIKYQSPNIEKYFGWTQKDMTNTNGWKYLHPEDIEKNQKKFIKVLQKENASTRIEFRYKCKNGIYKWVELTAVNRINDPVINGVLFNYHDITERKLAEEAMKESEEKFSSAFNKSPVSLAIMDFKTGERIAVNDKLVETFGYSRAHYLSGNLYQNHIAINKKELINVADKIKREGFLKNYPFQMVTKNGDVLDILLGAAKICNKHKNQFIVSHLDITEQKQAERELKKQRDLFELVINSIPARIFWKDLNSVYLGCNIPFAKDAGMGNPENVIGNNDTVMVWKEDTDKYQADDKQVIITGIPKLNYIEEFINIDGEKVFWQTNKLPLKNSNGKIIGIISVSENITEKLKIDNKLKKSEEQFRNLYSNSPFGIIICELIRDSKGKTIDFIHIEGNPSIETQTGFNLKDIVGKKASEIVDNKMLTDLTKKYENVVSTRETINYTEYFAVYDKTLEVRVYPQYGDRFIINFVDISNKVRAEKKLIAALIKATESDRLKTEFINNMSHEIRTPMNGILGFSMLLNKKNKSDEKRKYYVSIIQNSGNQLMRIIDDILEISQLGTKQVKTIEKEISLNNLLLELFSIFDIKAKENKTPLYLKKGFSDKDSLIYTDESKLNKILSNLLENALKFTSQGFIEFGYKQLNNELEIYVKDTGIGIATNKQETIFERFSQEEKELSRNVGGLGLGLSIAKENAELLGGKITLISEKGKGATFFVTIPYKPSNIKIENSNSTNDNNKIVEKQDEYLILIVEDEEVNYLYIETLLEDEIELNCKIIHAKHGKEAVEICKENSEINFILMDLKMPIMNGFEATKLIKEFRPELPIVAQTAYTTDEDREKAFLAGCDDFISKPISEETLNEIINKYLINK